MEIYAVKINKGIDKQLLYNSLLFLSENRLSNIYKLKNEADIHRSIIAELLVRYLLSEKLGLKNYEIDFQKNEFGKPHISDLVNFEFNLSHSGEWVVCALSSKKVGIDIEAIRPIDLDIARRFFSQDEYQDLLRKKPFQRNSYFFQLWTLKESYIKAVGKGLSIPLNSFSICTDDNMQISLYTDKKSDNLGWNFWTYDIENKYKLSICALENNFSAPRLISESKLLTAFSEI
ncbi:4'-phosphopantetheinyl transferase family protein [Bacillus wiedmannii]|uniref:4'-phosphopantetheinyl transferase family protein n=1 Tax=Bacillus wiedmannii TaxID=1890302 RepID=UPI0015CF2BFF|nr:4'-phosphopantetheinyl transferase superfamily protein [Bacillus wiedmannii]